MNIDEFLFELFGKEKGYVYAPNKRDDGEFLQLWYNWPEEADELEADIFLRSGTGDQYLSPVLWKQKNLEPDSFKLSNVVWCDFDEGTPDQLGDFPQPRIAVSSSGNPRKQHWYWRFQKPINDPELLEQYNRQLAYTLGADKGCWNFGRILRPIGTLNHKYSPSAPVSLVSTSEDTIDHHIFTALPSVDRTSLSDGFDYRILDLPSVAKKFPFSPEAWDFFTSPKEDGERHTALTSIAITCVEKGMTRDEAMTFLFDADNRWGKYVGRRDRERRLQSILLYAEQRLSSLQADRDDRRDGVQDKPGVGESEESTLQDNAGPRPFGQFVKHQFHVDWVIEDLIHKQGLAIVAAPPGIGKTQFSLNLALSVSSGRDFLNWKVSRPRRVLFLSLEMMQPELKFYLDKMATEFTEKEKELFDSNCFFLARQAFRLNSETNQRLLLDWIDEIQPEGIFIDSLSRCTGGDLEKGEIDTVFDFLNKEIRDKRGCFLWFVHHNRKANFQQKQPKKLEDLYGSQYIGAYASTVVGLWKISNQEIEVNCLKVWLSKPFKSFLAERSSNLTFKTRKTIDVA